MAPHVEDHARASLRPLVLLIVVTALIVAPATAWATHVFEDVLDASTHAEAIEYIADAGITRGCEDGSVYCPSEPVTRAQMASFLYRASGNGPVDPTVNAAQLDGVDADNYVFAPDGGVALLVRDADLTLTGGSPSECVEQTSLLFEPEFSVIYQLHATPAAIEPWDVNVQLNTSDVPPNSGRFEVCFATLDGDPLPAGTYRTFALMTLQ